jgi:hypothetical protein
MICNYKRAFIITNGVFVFSNIWFVYANRVFVFPNVWFVYANRVFVFLNLWFVYANRVFVFLNGPLFQMHIHFQVNLLRSKYASNSLVNGIRRVVANRAAPFFIFVNVINN